jgi:hypothetical protein
MVPPQWEPSGQQPHYGCPDSAFPASVLLGTISPIGGALLGRTKYTDPLVLRDLKVLFGPDEAAADALVAAHREAALVQYKIAFACLEPLERERFGTQSYFYQLELGNTNMEDGDVSDSD